jgi:hypothetical protein
MSALEIQATGRRLLSPLTRWDTSTPPKGTFDITG